MPRRKVRKSMRVAEGQVETMPSGTGLYAYEPQRVGLENKEKVTVSLSASLLNTIDEHVNKTGVNRSSIFEQALLMWCQWQQEQADIAYYSNLTAKDKATNAAWTQITTEAAKHIWGNEHTKISKKR